MQTAATWCSVFPAACGSMRMVVGGRYGLGSKDFTPAMAKAVFDNLLADKPRDKFTVGIVGTSSSAARRALQLCLVTRRQSTTRKKLLQQV